MRSTESAPKPGFCPQRPVVLDPGISGIRPLHLYIRVGLRCLSRSCTSGGQRVKLSLEGCLLCAHRWLDSASSGLNHGKARRGRWLSKASPRPMREWWIFTFLTTSRGSASAQQVNSNEIDNLYILFHSNKLCWVYLGGET